MHSAVATPVGILLHLSYTLLTQIPVHLNIECSILSAPFLHAPSHSILNKVVTIYRLLFSYNYIYYYLVFPWEAFYLCRSLKAVIFCLRGTGVSTIADLSEEGTQLIRGLSRWGSEVFSPALITMLTLHTLYPYHHC